MRPLARGPELVFFEASKIFWVFAAPANALLILLAVAPVLRWMGFERWSRVIGVLATLSLLIIAFGPAGNLLLRPLEDRFPQPPADLAAPTGIIVLGGSTDEVVSDARDQVTITSAATRITMGVALSRRFPDARLVFSGGSAAMLLHPRTEAEDTRRIWIEMGVPPGRIAIEDRSRNTFENAQFSRRLLDPKPGERWLLVTSAFHMPRAVGTFRAVGFPVVPYPVDYNTTGGPLDWVPRTDVSDNLRRFDVAAKEWTGLAVYHLTGRVTSLFPQP